MPYGTSITDVGLLNSSAKSCKQSDIMFNKHHGYANTLSEVLIIFVVLSILSVLSLNTSYIYIYIYIHSHLCFVFGTCIAHTLIKKREQMYNIGRRLGC